MEEQVFPPSTNSSCPSLQTGTLSAPPPIVTPSSVSPGRFFSLGRTAELFLTFGIGDFCKAMDLSNLASVPVVKDMLAVKLEPALGTFVLPTMMELTKKEGPQTPFGGDHALLREP